MKDKGGRPTGSKDTQPRKTKKRTEAMLATIATQGISTGTVALQNLQVIDDILDKTQKERTKLEALLDTAPGNLGHNDALEFIRRVTTIDEKIMSLVTMRQKWLSDIAKYTDYTKGQEKIVQDADGKMKTLTEILADQDMKVLEHNEDPLDEDPDE